jgi:hypothetical protein
MLQQEKLKVVTFFGRKLQAEHQNNSTAFRQFYHSMSSRQQSTGVWKTELLWGFSDGSGVRAQGGVVGLFWLVAGMWRGSYPIYAKTRSWFGYNIQLVRRSWIEQSVAEVFLA